jgi:ABC-2 type transport system permease protein
MRLIKPLDYQGTMLAISVGQMLNSALIITVPSMVVLFAVFGASVPVGWNVAFFLLSLPLAYLISVLIDFSVGLTSFYTESLWGISTAKEIIVLVLSGGLIPLRFFPEEMQRLLMYLPFQAIYHTPVSILTDPSRSIASDVGMIGIQALWAAALLAASRLFFNRALKAVTVNGG